MFPDRGTCQIAHMPLSMPGLNSHRLSTWCLNGSEIVYSVSMPEAMTALYVLAHDGRGRRRHALKGSILDGFTEQRLRRAAATSGTRILDPGCCAGDVAIIAAGVQTA
jgi:hypothetical protein